MLFDSHAHLDPRFFGDAVDAVVARAFDAGVSGIVAIGSGAGEAEMRAAVEVAGRHDGVWASVGIHPHDAATATPATFEALERMAVAPRVVAIGEAGLDFHYDLSPRDVQVAVFRRQVALAGRLGLPLVVHCREAHDECIEVLQAARGRERPGVIHCFTSGPAEARRYLDLGFLISIPGVVTFRNAGVLADAVREVPAEALLIETDSPFLAPVPMRGRPNEPAFVRYTAEAVARLKRLSVEDVARVTSRNARRLFGIADPDSDAPRLCYSIRDSLYVNMTNRCTLHCTFCGKFKDFVVKGHDLKLGRDPSREAIQAAIEAAGPSAWREVVFCGYGEPLLRLDDVKWLAARLKASGARVRVNTDGLASLVHGRDVPAELAGVVDVVSVSLNAPDAATYAGYCRSRYGEAAFEAVCAFLRRSREVIPEVWATVVELPGLDVEACRRLAEDVLGVRFRSRPYDDLG